MQRHGLAIAAIMGIALLASDPATADETKCRRTIAKAHTKYVTTITTALHKCKKEVVKRAHPPSLAACAPGLLEKVANAANSLRGKIAYDCGGGDRTCGAGGDDFAVNTIGWGIPQCMGFEGQCAGIAISDCGDIADCLLCMGELAAEQAVDGLLYDRFNDAYFHPNDDGMFARGNNRCEVAIAQASVKFVRTKSKLLYKCWEGKLHGKNGFDDTDKCPDTDPHVDTLVEKINVAELKKVRAICAACGGEDAVDTTACLMPGFTVDRFADTPFTCPNVSVPPNAVHPGGLDCGAITVGDLSSYIACIDCVLEFKVDCMAAASVGDNDPSLGIDYPTECN